MPPTVIALTFFRALIADGMRHPASIAAPLSGLNRRSR
jgi:hypothetical protein